MSNLSKTFNKVGGCGTSRHYGLKEGRAEGRIYKKTLNKVGERWVHRDSMG